MNYFELTGYKPEQVREDLTWEQAKSFPIYVITKSGNAWHKDEKISDEKLDSDCYAVVSSTKVLAFYFFEKAELNGMNGVKLHLFVNIYGRAKDNYDEHSVGNYQFNDRTKWVFITPDWRMYTMDGNPVTPKEIKRDWRRIDTPYWETFLAFAEYSHDMRVVGRCKEHHCGSDVMSPATVKLLKEVGFDMETPMADFASMLFGYQWELPLKDKDIYYTEDFLKNLKAPNRVRMRKKEIEAAPHDFGYYKNLLGDRKLTIMEDDGLPYAFIKSKGNSILAIGLKTPKGKSENYVYSELGKKKVSDCAITEEEILLFDSYRFYIAMEKEQTLERMKDYINILLENSEILAKTSAWRNVAPSLERLYDYIEAGIEDREELNTLFDNFRYFFTPNGQKDRVFEETIKDVGFTRALRARDFLSKCTLWFITPDLSKTTPYEQVGFTKSVYYSLKPFLEQGKTTGLGGLMTTIVPRMAGLTKKDKLSKFNEFCKAASPSFIEQIKAIDYDNRNRWRNIQWGSIMRMAGVNSESASIASCVESIGKLFPKISSDLTYEFSGQLQDYYRQLIQLSWLGAEWPVVYNEFHMGNILHCLNTIHGYDEAVNRVRGLIMISTNISQRVSLLHNLQNEITAIHGSVGEAERVAGLDKLYLPFKKNLKRNLEWSDGEYSIIVPDSLAELTAEGAMLHHCVGSYKDAVAEHREGIVFLRKAVAPKLPFFTIDVTIEPNGKYMIRQCHGDRNCNPSHELVEVLKKWSKAVGVIDEQSIAEAYGAKCHM